MNPQNFDEKSKPGTAGSKEQSISSKEDVISTTLVPTETVITTDQPRIVEVIQTESQGSFYDDSKIFDEIENFNPVQTNANKCETPDCACQQICYHNVTTNRCGCDCFDGYNLDCYGMCSLKEDAKITVYDITVDCPQSWIQIDGECFYIGQEYSVKIQFCLEKQFFNIFNNC